ncbi:EVE domain-domain-containing protein [Kockovaella imperatae]|uniref:EVE domain-domain-containing protein n=1 Tax=Kockovaella imperatae TaxID=4999 RepID=A0A1Y1US97_9TREE|nr:EVE domain-domain-containing protein [Kockovaella imperatae]ORX40822.1 EVE domain-domain-containing protein [Kockovaella imperatae]
MPWLMKAEPDSRVVKGKDVKFSVDDFEKIGTSPWDGVRNHEAKSIMKERMKKGDKVLFYHSNCKEPGVFALATIAREGYPDYTAWDASHPYFDAKTDKDKPIWFMVDVKFEKRLDHPPTLALVKQLASLPSLPEEAGYIGQDGLKAIKGMALVNRGRLSVQPVTDEAYEAVVKLGTKGGWESLLPAKGLKKTSTKQEPDVGNEAPADEAHTAMSKKAKVSDKASSQARRKAIDEGPKEEQPETSRRSKRIKR